MMRRMFLRAAFFMSGVSLSLAACSLAPDYKAPQAPTPAAYKESGAWSEAVPADDVNRGNWWTIFHDAQLDELENQVTTANQNLKIALAQYEQARAEAHIAQAAYFPTVTGEANGTLNQSSLNVANPRLDRRYKDYTLGADLSYEIDLWGRVRNTVAANEDEAQASAADMASISLSLHAELANDYFTLRGDDIAQLVLDQTVVAYQKAYDLTKNRFEGGASAEVDVDQAETALENAKTQAADIRLQRSQMEHAIAILIGQPPASFTLAPVTTIDSKLPVLHPGLPSSLISRRPDVAAAERRVAAANAEIGVARAAWLPTINLAGSFGFESASTVNLLSTPSEFWSLGPTAAMTVLNFGGISGLNEEARAAYDEAVGSYRQTVLSAYQDVEDNLAALHHLSDEAQSQKHATDAAARALKQANNLYTGGATTYLDVIVLQNADLQAKIAQVNILTRRFLASVQLVKALGGGWEPKDLNPPVPPAQ